MTRLVPALLLAALPTLSSAQAILHPSQIVGDIRFTNTNPEIVADPGRTLAWLSVESDSATPPLRTHASVHLPATTFANSSYVVTVDTSDAGVAAST